MASTPMSSDSYFLMGPDRSRNGSWVLTFVDLATHGTPAHPAHAARVSMVVAVSDGSAELEVEAFKSVAWVYACFHRRPLIDVTGDRIVRFDQIESPQHDTPADRQAKLWRKMSSDEKKEYKH